MADATSRARRAGQAAGPVLAGERADPDTVAWSERALGVPVIDHWWQTETGWPIAANCMGIEPVPVKRRIADAEPYRTPPTIDDPAILDEITALLRRAGYAG